MAYFEHNKEDPRRQRVFQEPVASDLDDALAQAEQEYPQAYTAEDGYDLYDEETYLDMEDMTEEERALARRDQWKVLAGIGDFLAVVVGTVVILLLVALLVSLINWVHADITQSFTLWQTKI